MPPLKNGRHELFAQELAKGATQDAAYEAAGYKPDRGNAARLTAHDSIQARVAELQKRAAEQTVGTISDVLAQFWAIATADPADLVEVRRINCRYCWGRAHRWQETRGERDRRRAGWEKARLEAAGDETAEAALEAWDDLGGTGYDGTRGPCEACPECFGLGHSQVLLKDLRAAPPAARRLFAGVKEGQHGVEVKMHDQVAALRAVGQHFGMFAKLVGQKDDKPFEHVIRWANSGEEAVRDVSEGAQTAPIAAAIAGGVVDDEEDDEF